MVLVLLGKSRRERCCSIFDSVTTGTQVVRLMTEGVREMGGCVVYTAREEVEGKTKLLS